MARIVVETDDGRQVTAVGVIASQVGFGSMGWLAVQGQLLEAIAAADADVPSSVEFAQANPGLGVRIVETALPRGWPRAVQPEPRPAWGSGPVPVCTPGPRPVGLVAW